MTEELWYPQNLEYFSFGDKLDCYLDIEPPDLGCNYHGAAYLIHAYAGEVDITDFLDRGLIKHIESEALCSYVSNS